MKQIKCPVCGGQLEASRSGLKMTCPYCDSVFEAPKAEEGKHKKEQPVFDPELFIVENKVKKELASGKNENTAESLRTMIYCLNEFETTGEIEKYMCKYISGSDLAAPGMNEGVINKVMPAVSSEMKSDEKVVLYYDRGIIFKCKEFMLVTNKRIFFVNKKKVGYIFHEDIDRMELDSGGDCPMWEINGDYQKTIPAIGSGTVQGAVVAYSCLAGFETDSDRQRIRLF